MIDSDGIPSLLHEKERLILTEYSAKCRGWRLEVGCLLGSSTTAIARGMQSGDVLISVDRFRTAGTGLSIAVYGPDFYDSWRCNTKNLGVEIYPLKGDSTQPEMAASVKQLLCGQMLRLLFLDGSHALVDIAADFWAYGSLVAPNGYILVHDQHAPGPRTVIREAVARGNIHAVQDDFVFQKGASQWM